MKHQKHLLTSTLTAGIGLAATLLAATAVAAENPGAHRHGHGQLQIAVEGNRVDLIFTSPAHNLAGFERDARTPEEHARLEDITQWLGTQPVLDTVKGSCAILESNIQQSGTEPRGDHKGHGHHHSEHHGHGDHNDHNSKQDNHREYEVSQQLECRDLNDRPSFNAVVMEKFPGLEELAVAWVSETGQGSARLEGGNTRFTLD